MFDGVYNLIHFLTIPMILAGVFKVSWLALEPCLKKFRKVGTKARQCCKGNTIKLENDTKCLRKRKMPPVCCITVFPLYRTKLRKSEQNQKRKFRHDKLVGRKLSPQSSR